jgi:ABC-type multidrug transport system fused ATPase/permease subunit
MFAKAQLEMKRLWQLIGQFAPYAQSSRAQITLALALTIMLPLMATFMYSLIQQLVDKVFDAQSRDALYWLVSAVVLVGLLRLLTEYCDQCLDARIGEQISQEARIDIYTKLIGAKPDLVQKRGVGAILAHLDGDVNRIASLIYGIPVGVFAHAAKAVCFFVFLLTISWKLTLIAVMVMPMLGWIVYTMTPIVRRSSSIARARSTAWMSRAEERLGAMPLIFASRAQEFETQHFSTSASSARKAEVRAMVQEARLSLAINLATGVGCALVLVVGVNQVQAQVLSVGAVLAFVAALGSLYDPLRGVTQGAGRWQRAIASAERLEILLQETVPTKKAAQNAAPLSIQGNIEFRQVSFSYGNGHKILNNISLSIKAGERVALVGTSGSGKSTLLRLLAGLQNAQSGSISLDGVNTNELSFEQLHAGIAIAFQEPYLFSGTIAENIRYNSSHVNSQQVHRAASVAQVDGFAYAMQHNLGTHVGARGGKLSGGQRQRVSLARALLRNAPILLLDEATSALDSETEENIHAVLRADKHLGTVITVSHRLSSVRSADRIIVLDQGRIVESGSPDELLGSRTRCYELFAAQIAAERSGAIPLFNSTDSGALACIRV